MLLQNVVCGDGVVNS